ncbi:MAG: glycine cleavage system aminomethyltransferase GcvT [Planctomycetota bacterium]|nr:glycine cleavage system aminomethyltransferase GcvT [Planctomycetota bacterium]
MKQTTLHNLHVSLGATMVPFAGYQMPVRYGSIKDEHHAVRTSAGLFDLGHMGRILITGNDRVPFLDKLVTNKVEGLETGAARYALMPNQEGNVLDDVIYYVFPELLLLVVNASNTDKILQWLQKNKGDLDAKIEDVTADWAMIALQGPNAIKITSPLTDLDLKTVKGYKAAGGTVLGIPCLVARTGYTGEDGFEFYFDANRAEFMFTSLLKAGKDLGLRACGLGARDTLRLEAGMPLYGHELDENTNPLEAGLQFAVQLDKNPFMGSEKLLKVQEDGPAKSLKGFFVEGRRIPRQGHEIFIAGQDTPCGVVSSGTHSPTLERALCMAYINGQHPEGTNFELGLGKKRVPLIPTKIPFYKRKRKKKKKKAVET